MVTIEIYGISIHFFYQYHIPMYTSACFYQNMTSTEYVNKCI